MLTKHKKNGKKNEVIKTIPLQYWRSTRTNSFRPSSTADLRSRAIGSRLRRRLLALPVAGCTTAAAPPPPPCAELELLVDPKRVEPGSKEA